MRQVSSHCFVMRLRFQPCSRSGQSGRNGVRWNAKTARNKRRGERVEHLVDRHAERLGLLAVHVHEELRHVGAPEHLRLGDARLLHRSPDEHLRDLRQALRATIAALYGGASEEGVVVCNGSAEANFAAMWRLVAPGDEVVVVIPTYAVGEPEPCPVFFERRVYQGSSGAVYPYPVIETLSDEDWHRQTACTLWTVKDIVAHQAAHVCSFTSLGTFFSQLNPVLLYPYLRKGMSFLDAWNQSQVDLRRHHLKIIEPLAAYMPAERKVAKTPGT